MSIEAMTWVLRHSEAKLASRLVLLALADYAHADGSEAYPAVDTLAQNTRLSRRSVQSALRALEDDGAIVRDGKGRNGTTCYSLIMGGAESAPPGAQSTTSGGAESAPNPSLEPSNTTTNTSRGLFEYWRERCNHPAAKFTNDRRRKIEARLRDGYSEQEIRQAILGAAVAPWTSDGKKFDDLELICRNGSKLEAFMARAGLAPAGPKSSRELHRELQRSSA